MGRRAAGTERMCVLNSSGYGTHVGAGLDPLTDCDNAPSYYGYGTYAASLIGGRRYGAAKKATLYSGVGLHMHFYVPQPLQRLS